MAMLGVWCRGWVAQRALQSRDVLRLGRERREGLRATLLAAALCVLLALPPLRTPCHIASAPRPGP